MSWHTDTFTDTAETTNLVYDLRFVVYSCGSPPGLTHQQLSRQPTVNYKP